MLIIRKNQVNNLIATVSMNKTLPNPYYLFSFQHIASKERTSFIPEVITSNVRYDKFRFIEGGNVNLQASPPEVWFGNYLGQYYYSIYEQLSPTNTDIDLTYNKLESGRAWVIVGDDNTQECFFEPYISNDEDFSQVIYVSEEEQFCISGDTTPVCPTGLTGECPTYLTRYSPLNSIYYKNTGTTANFLSSLDTCAPVQVAFDDTRMFMVDGCSNYYQYDYTITSGGCFNLSLVNKWDVWESSGATPNASYSLGIYDADNLIIGESASFVSQTGSTLYLYNLTTSGLTKWLEIGNSAQVYNIYYNTGNTQTILTYGSASGGTGYYQLYSGSTNPQLISQIPITIGIGGSTMYFSGGTEPVAVNVAGLQFPLNFSAGTMSILENSSGIPINYVDFGDGFDYLSNISQPASCYTFNISVIPPTPSPTPTNTATPTRTPTMTPTPTSTPCFGYEVSFVSSGATFDALCSNPQSIPTLYSPEPFFTNEQDLYYDKCLTRFIDFNTYPMFLSTGGTQLYAYTFAGSGLSTYGFTCPSPTPSITPTNTPTITPTPSSTPPLPPGVYAFPVSTGPTQNDACINTGIDVVLYGNKQFWFDYNPTDTFYLNTSLTIPASTYYAKYAPQNSTWYLVSGMPQPAGYMSC